MSFVYEVELFVCLKKVTLALGFNAPVKFKDKSCDLFINFCFKI